MKKHPDWPPKIFLINQSEGTMTQIDRRLGIHWRAWGKKRWFGNVIPVKFCTYRDILPILRRNLLFIWIFLSFSYKNSWFLKKYSNFDGKCDHTPGILFPRCAEGDPSEQTGVTLTSGNDSFFDVHIWFLLVFQLNVV